MVGRFLLLFSRVTFGMSLCFWVAAIAQPILASGYSETGARPDFSSVWAAYIWLLVLDLLGVLATVALGVSADRGKADARVAAGGLRWFSLAVLILVGGILVYMPFFGTAR